MSNVVIKFVLLPPSGQKIINECLKYVTSLKITTKK